MPTGLTSWRLKHVLLIANLLLALTVSAVGADATVARGDSPTPTADAETSPELARPCPNGRIRIRDLEEVDRVWTIAVEADTGIATEWREDAVLVSADVTCEFLAPEIRVRTVFYSAAARAFYEPETGRERPLDPGEPDLRALPAAMVSFGVLEEALEGEGIAPDDVISASGISIRYNTADDRFGPEAIPLDTVVFHVTIGGTLDARDYYVDAATGEVYHFGE